jgi:DNA-binding transcriptional ArsR family regulator
VPTYESGGDVWNVLGDRTRRTILECLADQPLAVVEIAERVPVSRPAVSQHLKVLRDNGLVTEETVGRRHIYRLNPTGVSALRDQLDTFWNRALAGYETALGRTTEDST